MGNMVEKKHNKKPFVTWQFFGTGPQSEDYAENVCRFYLKPRKSQKIFLYEMLPLWPGSIKKGVTRIRRQSVIDQNPTKKITRK